MEWAAWVEWVEWVCKVPLLILLLNLHKLLFLTLGKKFLGVITPIEGLEKGKPVTFQNSTYWMGPEVIISTAEQGRVRAFGRVWDFEGRSAELCKIKWGTH